MTGRPALTLALSVLASLVACKAEERTVTLTLGEQLRPLGFRCRDSMLRPLINRAIRGGAVHVAIAVDFVRLGGVPGCRPSELVSWCENHDCHAITEAPNDRRCVEVETGLATDQDETPLIQRVLSCPVQLDFVEGEILLDLPTLTDHCEEAVIGCANSLLQ